MARRPTPSQPESRKLNAMEIERGIIRIQKSLDLVNAFDPSTVSRDDPSSSVRPLETSIRNALGETFGEGTNEYNRFSSAAYFQWPINMYEATPYHVIVKAIAADQQQAIVLLGSAKELLIDRLESMGPIKSTNSNTPMSLSKRVFIIHGRDEGPREAVARFIQQIGLDPVILHEQANRGRTIIGKFNDEASEAGFAIALLTPDDAPGQEGGSPRARQNVIFELGFFLGKLGPSRVAAIVRKPIETPSDYDGVVYIDYGDWKMNLARELKVAGYSIDLNKIISL